jgi:hypothetical protein
VVKCVVGVQDEIEWCWVGYPCRSQIQGFAHEDGCLGP